MNCPKCGRQNRPEATFCAACGAALQASSQPQAAAANYPLMRGPDMPAAKNYARDKNPFIAMLVSFFFPAGGQLYNGDFKKMGAIWFAYIICLLISFTGVGVPPAFVMSVIIWAWAIFDAYSVAKREKALW